MGVEVGEARRCSGQATSARGRPGAATLINICAHLLQIDDRQTLWSPDRGCQHMATEWALTVFGVERNSVPAVTEASAAGCPGTGERSIGDHCLRLRIVPTMRA